MSITVRPVASPEDFERFVDFPFRLHRDEPRWVPPLREIYVHVLTREQNPYFEHADAEYLLAERDGEVVGHIIAHIDDALNEYQGNRWGLFGFFEAEDDQEIANALVDAAAEWLSERGRDRMVGPLYFSTKEDPGVLVEGFERPVILQPWHPPYYGGLLEGAGLEKARDVLWRQIDLDEVPEELLAQASKWATTVKTKYGVTIRPPREEEMEADLEAVFRFIPPVFESHWCYVPWTESEMTAGLATAARMMGPGTLMAELDGELIGASMVVPDFNQAFVHENGQVVRTEKKIDQARLLFMGVAPEYRHLGIMPALSHVHIEDARRRGINRLVIGWSHEDNKQMNVGLARLGLEVAKRHRIYEKELDSASSPSGEPATSE